MKLDRYDRAIVRPLPLDGRITNSQLAETVNLSESASLRRVRALEESGFIEGYTALINQQKAGCPVNVFVNITLERQEQAHLRAFEGRRAKFPRSWSAISCPASTTICSGSCWPTPPTSSGCTASISPDCPMWPGCIPALRCARCKNRASCPCATRRITRSLSD